MSFLLQLKRTAPPAPGMVMGSAQAMEWATAPILPGQRLPKSQILPTLRRTQLYHLAKAYDIDVDPNSTKDDFVSILEVEETKGVFNAPPHHPLWFERAKFNSDSMQQAKSNGGFEGTVSRPGRFVTVLGRWTGPLPPEEKAPEIVRQPKEVADKNNLSKRHELQKRAKAMGIKAGGRSNEATLKEMAIRQGEMAREPETAA